MHGFMSPFTRPHLWSIEHCECALAVSYIVYSALFKIIPTVE